MWKRTWAWPSELRKMGVIGLNERNLFINTVNKREFYPRVDNKVLTKKICQEIEIAVPETYTVISKLVDVKAFLQNIHQYQEFVVKPARGSGGRGIIVISRHENQIFYTPGNTAFSVNEIRYRISTILSGLYSLGGNADEVIVEQRIKPHTIFGSLAVSGTPDIRIILCENNPIMAMLRLPTEASRGRANLHQGAVGVGIDIDTGLTTHGVFKGNAISIHPDTKQSISGITINDWTKILDLAKKLSQRIELGYLGIDIVLDVERGPLVLEANARPGLAIQVANKKGIKTYIT